MAITSPKRMYIVIPKANANSIESGLILSEVAIDGKPISGYNRVVYVQQRGENVMLCLGG
jgi:archaellum component FlaG (FlaF/FlaG flagellin family)